MTARQITRCGVLVALLAVSAWVTIPLGAVPFTLQTMVLAMIPVAVGRREALTTIAVYLLIGAVGLPVFSGFGGGIAQIVGPTGGYLWGVLVGMVAAELILALPARVPQVLREGLAVAALLAVAYVMGTIQLMAVTGMALPAALAAAVIPFIIPDAVKLAVGVAVGRSVRRALAALGSGADARA